MLIGNPFGFPYASSFRRRRGFSISSGRKKGEKQTHLAGKVLARIAAGE
jgi:hypothetical protein